ncbi:MAG: sugar transferase [Deltaproteobacteria bacterium]
MDSNTDTALKRPFDIALSLAGIALSLPLWVLIAAAVKIEDGGPVFYRSKRVGRGGRVFETFKFRSMIADSDSIFGPAQAREGDKRITRTGRILRATAMDELPQLINILRGDMSFVGPRALMPAEIEIQGADSDRAAPLSEIPGYAERHSVRPGLTGIAQIYAPRDISRRNKFRYDLVYIRRPSFALDLRLIALSFWITFRGKWESRGRKF